MKYIKFQKWEELVKTIILGDNGDNLLSTVLDGFGTLFLSLKLQYYF